MGQLLGQLPRDSIKRLSDTDTEPLEFRIRKGGTERTRTSDTRFRKPLLYPLSYSPGVTLHACWRLPKYTRQRVASAIDAR